MRTGTGVANFRNSRAWPSAGLKVFSHGLLKQRDEIYAPHWRRVGPSEHRTSRALVVRSEFEELFMDPAVFKEGMRRLAASVCVITTIADGELHGLTATAICSLSVDPPSLLCCLNKSGQTSAAIGRSRLFCVNVLSLDDTAVAHRFASNVPGARKFEEGSWTIADGMPVLKTALVSFNCATSEIVSAGSHDIFIGLVSAVGLGGGSQTPLVYAHGGYGQFTAADAQATLASN